MRLYHIHRVLFVVLICPFFELSESRRISIERNGYRDVNVFLPLTVLNKTRLINAVKEVFRSAYDTIYIATKRRAYFASVTLVVPDSWGSKEEWMPDNSSVWHDRLDFYEEADIEISDEMEGRKPLTLHRGGCGEQAVRIYLPPDFFTSQENVESKSREFVHHWAQYRYGIFPEGGFQSDSRYPLYYSIPGTHDVEITDCTNIPLNYTMMGVDETACEAKVNAKTGRPESPQCLYKPVEGFSSLKSSLMYQQSVAEMSDFCHGETVLEKLHNVAAPSKHNALCGEESTWFVILRNQDFFKGRNQATKYRPLPITFKYVQQSSLRLVVALETSAHMNINSRYSIIKNALAKFILYDLPSGTKFGLVSYSDEETVTNSLLTLETKELRQNFLESVPFKEDAGPYFNRCATCAVNASIELLRNDDDLKEGGLIILITTASCDNSSTEDLRKKLLRKGIKIFIILFSQDQYSNCTWESVSASAGGLVYHITESVSQNSIMAFTYLTFASIIKGYTSPSVTEVLLVQEILPDQTDVSVPFHTDDAVDQQLRMFITGLTFDTQNSPLVADFTNIRCGPGEEFSEFERQHLMPAWVFDIARHEGSNCTFETKWKDGASNPVLIFVTQKWQVGMKPITVHAMLNHKNQTVKSLGQPPLKIFADIRAGIQPIIGAEATVLAYHPDGRTSEFLLIDDGIGDPDVTMNDGIYSSYFTNYSAEGHYSFIFKISSKETTKRLEVDNGNCCGSFMPYKSIEEVKSFTRLAGPLSVFLADKPPQKDVHSPNQIFDVRVSDVDLELKKYTFQWTAAGDDCNHGVASGYKLKVFSDRTQLRYDFEDAGFEIDLQRDVIHHTPPAEYGSLQEFVARLPNFMDSGVYYFGVRAIDDAGNYGPVSNTVPIFLRTDVREKNNTCDAVDPESGNNGVIRCTASISVLFNLILALCLLHLY